MEVTEGKQVDLECRAVGKPLPRIAWYNKGDLVDAAKGYDLSAYRFEDDMKVGSKLRIDKFVPKQHEGTFTIKVINEAGKATYRLVLTGNLLHLSTIHLSFGI